MIKSKDDLPRSIFIQWKDDDGNLLHGEDQTWCHDRIYKNDVRYILDNLGRVLFRPMTRGYKTWRCKRCNLNIDELPCFNCGGTEVAAH